MSRLWYKDSSDWDWNKALPIGNGRLGAMIYGEKTMEHYQLNEETVWSGKAMERVNPDAKKNLEKVRHLIFEGKIPQAERLLKYAFTATPQSERAYQTLGDLYIDLMDTVKKPVGYERSLDLDTAIHTIKVTDASTNVRFQREAFVSQRHNVIATRLTADQANCVSAAAMITRGCFTDKTWYDEDGVYFTSNLGSDDYYVCAGLLMIADGVEVTHVGEQAIAEHAQSITIYVTAATTYREENPKEAVKKQLKEVARCSYDEIRKQHIKEYQAYFQACRLELEYDKELDQIPTDERLKRDLVDNGLITTYFDYGRYLLISSSRPGTLPANLQGIWNKDMTPPWESKYTVNINAQMNYWPAEMLGLSDCHLPLIDLLKKLAVRGEKTAREMYGCRGFVVHHNTDIWADTAPQDMWNPATYWVMGGAWLCTHVWEHYQYTRDVSFLREFYPIIEKAVLFFVDYLVEHDGYYVTCPSVSPENTYILPDGTKGCNGYGVTMDNQILRDLFSQYLEAGKILNMDENDVMIQAKERLDKLPPMQIGSKGQLLEWIEEYAEEEPGHRHISHLYGLYPSSQIMVDETPDLAKAAEITLKGRLSYGGGHTGWSRAWIINMYARLWQSEKAFENLQAILTQSTQQNMLDTHPPFQIDGNFGATAAIGEMLLQSNHGRTVLLPALPKQWSANGSIYGIRGRGGIAYDLMWTDGSLTKVTARGLVDQATTILVVGNKKIECVLKKDEVCDVLEMIRETTF